MVTRNRPALLAALCVGVLWPFGPARAESARFIDLQGFSRLLEGDPQSTSLSEDGAIGLSLAAQDRYVSAGVQLGAACLWGDEVVAVQTGEAAHVVAIDAHGKERLLLADLNGRIVTRLAAFGPTLVLAMAPKPHLVIMGSKGKSETVPVPDVGFVWDMLKTPDNSLIVATGEPGRVLKRSAGGTWQILFEADEAHIKTLAYDAKLGLFAGGGERGIVYHGDLNGHFRALFDSGNTEITALAVDGNALYAAAVSGAQAALAPAGQEGQGAPAKGTEVRSNVVRIGLDGASDVLAGSNDEIVFDLLRERPGSVLLATGAVGRREARGRLYRLNAATRSIALLHQSTARRLVQLLPHPSGQLLAVGQEGTTLTAFSPKTQNEGVYISPAFDTGINSTFGAVQALGEFPPGSRGTLRVRSGQTAEPDASWSPWSGETDATQALPCKVPPGRYAQIRLTLKGKPGAQPEVLRLRLSYLRQNIAPFVRDISVMDKGLAWTALPSSANAEDQRSKIVVLGGSPGDEGNPDASRKPPARARQIQERGALTVRWLADDANGDDLSYTLWMRPLDQQGWRLLGDNMTDPFFTLQSQQLKDGYYLFRVRASDVRSNPLASARQDERVSRPVLVDNTPPVFGHVQVRVKDRRAYLTGEVMDAAGLLTQLQYALDGGPLRPWAPADGVLDGPKERLDGDLGPVSEGTHTLTLVAQDEAQNDAYTSITFSAPRGP